MCGPSFGKTSHKKKSVYGLCGRYDGAFSCYKAEDDWEDEHSLKGLVYSYLLGRKFRKKPLLYQEKVRNISLAMQNFADAEKQGNADIDTMAGLFGRVMAQIVSCREDEWKDNLERLGFFLGKFIYLLDAYEDIEQDLKKEPIIR